MNAIHAAVLLATSYVVSTVAGIPGVSGDRDGGVAFATLNQPTAIDIVFDADCSGADVPGDMYVVDNGSQSIRRISAGVVTTFVPLGTDTQKPYVFDFGDRFGGAVAVEPSGSGCGCSLWDRGFFVASTGKNEVPEFSADGNYANRHGVSIIGSRQGETLKAPSGLALSPNFANGVTRFLYITNAAEHTIRRVTFPATACSAPSLAQVFVGKANAPGGTDGGPAIAQFNSPHGIATAPDGSLYVADTGNHVIRRVGTDGSVSTVAGDPGLTGSNDGQARAAHFNSPMGVAVGPTGEVYIADTGNNTIRMLTTDGNVITIAGTAGPGSFADGTGSAARFSSPIGLRVGPDGALYVADSLNQVIRRITSGPLAQPKRRAVRQHR